MEAAIFPVYSDGESDDAIFEAMGARVLDALAAALPQAVEVARERGATGLEVTVTL